MRQLKQFEPKTKKPGFLKKNFKYEAIFVSNDMRTLQRRLIAGMCFDTTVSNMGCFKEHFFSRTEPNKAIDKTDANSKNDRDNVDVNLDQNAFIRPE